MTTRSTGLDLNSEKSLIDYYLEEQRSLTAVEKFACHHEAVRPEPASRRYADLIPLGLPGEGQQYGFEVDLDSCSGCKACVTACHSLNGLEDGESWRSTGTLHGYQGGSSWQQTISTACHHCADPACLNGCPVLAYEKDPVTGIVRHLDDQCMGCQYCVMKCPYEVPRYSARRGIVRKCDMCATRLRSGEAPGCAQACPNSAIRIRLVDTAGLASDLPLLPTAPSSLITRPTTRFVSRNALPSDAFTETRRAPRVEPAHWPLVFMLVITQASVGLVSMTMLASSAGGLAADILASALAFAGVGVSTLHLGRPQKAWRSFLGLRKSWLSREIVFFGAYVIACLALMVSDYARVETSIVRLAAMACGWVGLASSVMVYADTRRPAWKLRQTAPRFGGTTILLGTSLFLVVAEWRADSAETVSKLQLLVLTGAVLKILGDAWLLQKARVSDDPSLRAGAQVISRDLAGAASLRFVVAAIGLALVLWPAGLAQSVRLLLGVAGILFLAAGELLERLIFFRAVAPPQMPGKAEGPG